MFDGLEHIRASIFIFFKDEEVKVKDKITYSTNYQRWYSESRPTLFSQVNFQNISNYLMKGVIPKIGNPILADIFKKLENFTVLGLSLSGNHLAYFHNAPQYWIRAMSFAPYFWNERDGGKLSTQIKKLKFSTPEDAQASVAALNSSLFYIWFVILSDCRHLNMREIENFPVSLSQMPKEIKLQLGELTNNLMSDYESNKKRKECRYKTTGEVVYDEYFPRKSKSIIDKIDTVLAKHYGLTNEELDFVINYDIKYRMGADDSDGEDV